MARPQREGLLYFPFDVEFFSDKKIKILRARYGVKGVSLYIYLLCEVYKNGYYVKLDDDYEYLISGELNMSAEEIKQVMRFLLERSLFDYKLFQSDNVITSLGIQRRFQEAVKSSAKRSPRIIDKFWLLSEEETQSFIKVTHFQNYALHNPDYVKQNGGKSENNDTKEKKVKEIKEKEIKDLKNNNSSELLKAPEPEEKAVIELTLNDKSQYPVYKADIDRWGELYPAVDIIQELRKMAGWIEANPQKRKTRTGIKKFINSWLSKAQDKGGNLAGMPRSTTLSDVPGQFKTAKEKSYEAMMRFAGGGSFG